MHCVSPHLRTSLLNLPNLFERELRHVVPRRFLSCALMRSCADGGTVSPLRHEALLPESLLAET